MASGNAVHGTASGARDVEAAGVARRDEQHEIGNLAESMRRK